MRNFKTDSVYFSFFIPAALIHSVNIYQVPAVYTDLNTGYSSKQNFIQNVYVYSKGRQFFFFYRKTRLVQLALFLLAPLLPVTEKYLLGLLGLSSGMYVPFLLFLATFF